MLRKSILILLTTIISLNFISCNSNGTDAPTENQLEESKYIVNDFENVSVSISKDSISSNAISLEFTYYGENQLLLGKWFVLEVYEDGKWYTLPYEIEITWDAIAYDVDPNQSRTMIYNWENIYPPLSRGKYRIVTQISDYKESGNSTQHYLATEFNIE